MAIHNRVGRWGEAVAVEYLMTLGYAIVETNWRSGHNEIDIIATRGNRLVFVEVKTRTNDDYDPLEAIDNKKKNHIIRSANSYIRSRNLPYEVQYDIVTIVGDRHDYKLEHIPDAFFPSLVTRRTRR